jgi:hypothetical protein
MAIVTVVINLWFRWDASFFMLFFSDGVIAGARRDTVCHASNNKLLFS